MQAKQRTNADLNSFNGFEPPKRESVRIDWILTRGAAEVPAAAVLDYAEDGRFPSDHFPVTATVKF